MYPALMKSSALPEAQCTAVTDADGRYIINDIPISGMEYASYSASASKEGFKPRLKGFSPEVGGTSVVDFVLTPLSTPVAPAATVRPGRNALQAGADNRSVIVDLARPTALTVSVFSLDGRAEGAAVRTRMLGAGRHEIALNAETDNARNTRIVRVTGDSFSRSAILSHTSERR